MTYGFRALGESGAVQIDDSYSNLLLFDKGSVTTATLIGNTGASYVDVTFTNCVSPSIALRATSSNIFVNVFFIGASGSSWTYRFIAGVTAGATTTTGTVIEYFRFDVQPPPSGPGWGLRVRKADGTIAFDSSYKPLRVIDFLNFTWSSVSFPSVENRTYGAVGKIAFLPARVGNHGRSDPLSGASFYRYAVSGGWATGNNSVQLGPLLIAAHLINAGGQQPNPPRQTSPDWLIVDVTNY